MLIALTEISNSRQLSCPRVLTAEVQGTLKAGFARRNQCLVAGNILLLLPAAAVAVAVAEAVVMTERVLLNPLPYGEAEEVAVAVYLLQTHMA